MGFESILSPGAGRRIALSFSYKPLIMDVLPTQACKQGGSYLLLAKDQSVTQLPPTMRNFGGGGQGGAGIEI
jgi:hypothetical protein